MKLPKKIEQQLREAVAQLDTGIAFILDPNTIIGRRTSGNNATVWKDNRGLPHYSTCKEIGSDLTGLYNARQTLERLLRPVVVEPEPPEPPPLDEPAEQLHVPRFPGSLFQPEPKSNS